MKLLPLALLGAGPLLMAQTGVTLVGAGYYDDPSFIRVAPGQLVTLFATAVRSALPPNLRGDLAGTLPLPTVLAGVSVTLHQFHVTSQELPPSTRQLPVLAVEQINQCGLLILPGVDCYVTAITVHIPYDITVPPRYDGGLWWPGFQTELVISDSAGASRAFRVLPVFDQVHVARSCDMTGQFRGAEACWPMITHPDGRLVWMGIHENGDRRMTDQEARPGETLVMYALGLGRVSPMVQAGEATPTPAPVTISRLRFSYEYRPNWAPEHVPALPAPNAPELDVKFTGLVAGFVGLYQVNFVVPPPPLGLPPSCPGANLVIGIAGDSSADGVGICVNPSLSPITGGVIPVPMSAR